jgi:hypothetical protein
MAKKPDEQSASGRINRSLALVLVYTAVRIEWLLVCTRVYLGTRMKYDCVQL